MCIHLGVEPWVGPLGTTDEPLLGMTHASSEAVPTVPCHQAASCPMLLWFFPRNLTVIQVCRVTAYNFLYTIFFEGYRWVMDFKATASRGVLIAHFGEYFDNALFRLKPGTTGKGTSTRHASNKLLPRTSSSERSRKFRNSHAPT